MTDEDLPDNVSGVAFRGEDPVYTDHEHKHDWQEATTTSRKEVLTFWICISCGSVSPGPTDNEGLRPSNS